MEFEGTVLQVLPQFRTQTQRGEFVKQEVVFEQPGEFARKAVIAFTGDRIATAAALQPGQKVKVSINIESREWNGRWFTEVRGWKIEQITSQPAGQVPVQPQQSAANVSGYPSYANQSQSDSTGVSVSVPSSTPNEADDLPF